MNRLLSCAAAILIVTTAGSTRADTKHAGTNPAEGEAIKSLVLEAQRAGFEKHDFKKYMTQWADDARIVFGRTEQPGKHETVYDRQQIEATRRLRFQGKPRYKVAYRNVRVEVDGDGDEAILRLRSEATWTTGSETGDEVYRLRRTDDGWKVYENRYRLVRNQYGDEATNYDTKKWRELDAKIDVQRVFGNRRGVAFALYDAWRFREAHQAMKRQTAATDAAADDWVFRGAAAVMAGDAEDAKASFAKALSLDPEVRLPDYARAEEEAGE